MFRSLAVGAFLLALLASGAAPLSIGAQTPPERWLLVSDLHFNPFANPRLVDRLAAAPAKRWRAIFESDGRATYSGYGKDTNYPLFASSLGAMKRVAPEPAAILYAGDFLAHDFRRTFAATASKHDDAAYAAFVDKTIEFIAGEFRRTFPHTIVFPAIGNNDGYCGDYRSTPGSPFFAHLAKAFAYGYGGAAASFEQQFAIGGYDAIDLSIARTRLVVLNDVLWSSHYDDACGDPKADPGGDEMTWLQRTIASTPPGQRSWVLMHVPAGVDAYATLHAPPGATTPIMMLADRFNEPLLEQLAAPTSHVSFVWSGHVHMNAYRVLASDNSNEIVPNLVIPAVSPVFYSNPSFAVAEVDAPTAEVVNERVYVLHDLSALAKHRAAQAGWSEEYDFDNAYGASHVNAGTLEALQASIFADPRVRARFSDYYDGGSGRAPIGQADWRAYWCADATFTAPAYQACRGPAITTDLPPQPTPPPAPTATPSPVPSPVVSRWRASWRVVH